MALMAADIKNLYSTVRVRDGETEKSFVTIIHPPKDWQDLGLGIPKVILSRELLPDDEIDQQLREMAQDNARWIAEQARGE
jgi:hypothetical protein